MSDHDDTLKTGDRITTDEQLAEMHTLLTGELPAPAVNTMEQAMIISLLKRVTALEKQVTELMARLNDMEAGK